MEEVTRDYWGIADCHGLQSFIPQPHEGWNEWGLGGGEGTDEMEIFRNSINMASMTARANSQRWTVVYKAEVRLSDAEILEEILKINPEEALKALKKCALKIEVARGMGNNVQRMWDSIPNSNLDPGH